MRKATPVHGLTVLFLAGLLLVTLVFRARIPLWHSLLFRYTVLLGLVFALKLSSDRQIMGRWALFLYRFSPVLFVVLIFQSLGDLIQYLRPDIDPELIKLDRLLFGIDPTLWMERWIVPWFTDLMSLAYISYYFLPVVLVSALYLKRRISDFDRVMFILALGYYASFAGYILFPAIGPRYTMASLYSVPLEGSFITDFVRDILNSLEHNKRDCMPSGHTQIALMVLFLSYRFRRPLFYVFLPIVCGLVLSTVYLRYHYVVDLAAGVCLAVGCVILGPLLYERWGPEAGVRDEEEPED